MILTDREIRISIVNGLIDVTPEPSARAYSSTSLDLSLGNKLREYHAPIAGLEQTIDPADRNFRFQRLIEQLTDEKSIEGGYKLEPSRLVLAWTSERVNLKANARLAARVEGKSSLARLGLVVHMTAPVIHAGFAGLIQLEVVNFGPLPIRLSPGMPICQLVFESTMGVPDAGYSGQFANQGG